MSYYDELVKGAVTRRNNQVRQTVTEANKAKRRTMEQYWEALKLLERNRSEGEQQEKNNYSAMLSQLLSGHGQEVDRLKTNTTSALQEAYLNMRTAQRDLPQMLGAGNITGGAAESIAAGMRNSYGGERAALIAAQMQAIAQLEASLSKNRLDLDTGHGSRISELQKSYMNRRLEATNSKNKTVAEIGKSKNASRTASDKEMGKQVSSARSQQAKAAQQLALARQKAELQLQLAREKAAQQLAAAAAKPAKKRRK